jgi:hypothetical protein
VSPLDTGKSFGRATLDGYAASDRAVREMENDGLLPKRTTLQQSRLLDYCTVTVITPALVRLPEVPVIVTV